MQMFRFIFYEILRNSVNFNEQKIIEFNSKKPGITYMRNAAKTVFAYTAVLCFLFSS
jgi:hypothetical protein